MFKKLAVLAIAITALVVVGCGNDDSGTTSSSSSDTATHEAMANGDPSVSFVTPTDGAETGSTVNAKVDVKDFMVDPKHVGKAAMAGHGHIHFSMDNGKYDQPKYSGANGDLAKKLGVNGKYSPSVTPSITYKGLPAGKHTLKVNLANNDHSDTGVSSTVNFTVK